MNREHGGQREQMPLKEVKGRRELGGTWGSEMDKGSIHMVHIFSRFKTYSGAAHLVFRFVREADRLGQKVTIVTRYIPDELRRHIPEEVEVRTLRWAHKPTRFHFVESICDVLYSPFLFLLVPTHSTWDIYWNDNTLASLFIDSLLRRKRRVFYCLQLPEFAYGHTLLVTRSYPPLSWLVPIFVPFYRWLDKRFARRADLIIALSNKVQADCVRVYGRPDVAVAGPGIDIPGEELIDPQFIRRRLPIKTDHVLVTVGKLIPKKNMDIFVKVVHLLRQKGVDVSGVIIGDGPLSGSIEHLIRSLKLEPYCLMTGFVPEYEDVQRLLSGATVHVFLEKLVPFGLTPLEAGSLRVAVVAYEGGGVEETVVYGENGYKLPLHYGVEQIAEVLQGMLLGSPNLLRTMGRKGASMALNWTWDRAYDRFLGNIEDVR